jgi:hypothetical protein
MNFPELDNLELEKLKKQVRELSLQIEKYKALLKENDVDLEEQPSISNEELICVAEIAKLKEMSDKGGLMIEDVKILEILVKTLLSVRGKAPEPEKKKAGARTVGELLSIVNQGSKK